MDSLLYQGSDPDSDSDVLTDNESEYDFKEVIPEWSLKKLNSINKEQELYLCDAIKVIESIPVWDKQRILSETQVKEILEFQLNYYKEHNCFNFLGPFYICCIDNKDHRIIDGQHRLVTIHRLITKYNFKSFNVLVWCINVENEEQRYQIFRNINSAKPISLPDLFLDKTSNIINECCLRLYNEFPKFFQNTSLPKIPYLQEIIENKNYLFMIILIRFLIVYIEAMNIQKLRFDIESNLRIEILNDVFSRGNFSVADSYFYVNTLTVHISQFYQNVTMFFSSLIKVFSFSIFILYTNQEIFIYFIFGSVLLYFPTKYFTKLNKKFANDSYYSALEISNDLERVVDNLYLIKILNKYQTEIKTFKDNLDEYYYSQLNNQKYGIINSIVPTFSTMLILSIVLLFF